MVFLKQEKKLRWVWLENTPNKCPVYDTEASEDETPVQDFLGNVEYPFIAPRSTLTRSCSCPVYWGCRIHRLLLCRGVRLPLTSVLDLTLKQSDGEVPAVLEL